MKLLSTSKLNLEIGTTQICENLSFECKAGEVWGIIGRNGKGKTTLLHSLAGLLAPIKGDIFLKEKNINSLSRRQIAQQLGVLLQHHEDSFPGSVLDTVITGRHPHIQHWQWENKMDWQIAMDALKTVQLSHLKDRPINQLSGGERQRVAIATLITQNPDIILLDEPNSHLDLKYQIELLNFFTLHVKENKKILLMTLHDINLSARYCDHLIMLMGDNKVLHGKTKDLLTEDNLQLLYDYPVKRINADKHNIFIAE